MVFHDEELPKISSEPFTQTHQLIFGSALTRRERMVTSKDEGDF